MITFQARRQLFALTRFRNPWSLVLDRIGWRRAPYSVVSRTGAKIMIRPQTSDRFTAFEVFGLGVYDEALKKLSPGDVVVDIGANIGCFAVESARIVGPSGKVFAVEPEAHTYGRLVENIRLNRLSQIAPILCAIAGKTGVAELRVPRGASLFTSMYGKVDGRSVDGELQRVECFELEELFETHNIRSVALLKLDCEGAEHKIIETISPKLAQRITNVIIEFHRVPGSDIRESIDNLKALGYAHSVRQNHLFSR